MLQIVRNPYGGLPLISGIVGGGMTGRTGAEGGVGRKTPFRGSWGYAGDHSEPSVARPEETFGKRSGLDSLTRSSPA